MKIDLTNISNFISDEFDLLNLSKGEKEIEIEIFPKTFPIPLLRSIFSNDNSIKIYEKNGHFEQSDVDKILSWSPIVNDKFNDLLINFLKLNLISPIDNYETFIGHINNIRSITGEKRFKFGFGDRVNKKIESIFTKLKSDNKYFEKIKNQIKLNNTYLLMLSKQRDWNCFFKELPNTDECFPVYNKEKNYFIISLTKKITHKKVSDESQFIEELISVALQEIFYSFSLLKRTWTSDKELVYSTPKNNKTAVIITGQLRNKDAYEKIETIKMMTSELDNPEYFVLTWDKHLVKTSPFGGKDYTNNWVGRISPSARKFLPKEIESYKNLKTKLPLTHKLLSEEKKIEVDVKRIEKIFDGNVTIKLYSEEDVDKKYEHKDGMLTRGGSLNQLKMFMLIYESANLIKYSEDYSKVLRVRPDLSYLEPFFKERFDDLKPNQFITGHIGTMFAQDAEILSDNITFQRMYGELYEEIIHNEGFEILEANNVRIKCDSHKLISLWFQSRGIEMNSSIAWKRKNMYNINHSFGDINSVLEMDLEDNDLIKDKDSIRKFFSLISE